MSELIAVLGAKGGVGKTTACINLVSAFSQLGRQATILEANLGTPDIGFFLGQPLADKTINQVMSGHIPLSEAFLLHPSGARVIQASVNHDHSTTASYEELGAVIPHMKNYGDIVLVDTPSGTGSHVETIIRACDSVILIAGADIASQNGALRSLLAAQKLNKPCRGIILNKAENMHISAARGFIGQNVISVIPHDESVPVSVSFKYPAVFLFPEAPASKAYMDCAKFLISTIWQQTYG